METDVEMLGTLLLQFGILYYAIFISRQLIESILIIQALVRVILAKKLNNFRCEYQKPNMPFEH